MSISMNGPGHISAFAGCCQVIVFGHIGLNHV